MSYEEQQLFAAVQTAVGHPEAATRERAHRRAQAWVQHLAGVLASSITTGTRVPVRGLPAWVTLDVLHGGFASGSAAAGGPLADDERDLAREVGVPLTRAALNSWFLTDEGRARLGAMLDDGRYDVVHPENAALLVVAWLVRAGDTPAAVSLLEEVGPFLDRIRFYPVATEQTEAPAGQVFRRSEATTHEVLASRAPNPRVEAQREALTVWAPFADELLALWWPLADGGTALPDRSALADAAVRYRALAATHTRTTAHTSSRTNLGVLVAATLRAEADDVLPDGERSRVAHAVRSMAAKRGAPGSADLARARDLRRDAVRAPSYAAVAHVVAERLDDEATRRGVVDPDAVLVPVAAGEATEAVPAGAAVPSSAVRIVGLAAQATVEELHERGVVPSAEVLAELAPQLVGAQHAATYPDPDLGLLMARTYRAFRRRRSLLLTDLSAQVKLAELPWVVAVAPYRTVDDAARDAAAAALHQIGGLYLEWFGGTPLPNPLLVELEALAGQAGLDVPLVPELAADIFRDAFSGRFPTAAALVAKHAGPEYLAYYGLGADLDELARQGYDKKVFASICRRRAADAGSSDSWSVTRNGMVIEQAQLLTSHNLAALAALGVPADAEATARVAFDEVLRLVRSASRPGADRYLAMSDARAAGLAWRHVVWFTALLPERAARALVHDLKTLTGHESPQLMAALSDLAAACAGTAPSRALLGWSNGPHPLLVAASGGRSAR
ncbi:hypothetical protein ACIGB8_02695 [Promicromonospora sukumoe]|uniref:hypothetical protein n=1 Tax=Promicromonospora sukumoe TaxID=88382 RepID=UPI0037CB4AF4